MIKAMVARDLGIDRAVLVAEYNRHYVNSAIDYLPVVGNVGLAVPSANEGELRDLACQLYRQISVDIKPKCGGHFELPVRRSQNGHRAIMFVVVGENVAAVEDEVDRLLPRSK